MDNEAAMHMQNASVVLDVQMMNSPMCTYMEKEHCTYVFQPVYGDGQRVGHCTREFRVCYRGWDCYMRCDDDLILDPRTGKCLPEILLQDLQC